MSSVSLYLILTYIAGPLSCENSQWKMRT